MRIRHGLLFTLVLLAGCAQAPAEQRLRERIGTMQAAIEARNVTDFMDGVAEDFIGRGTLDRAALQQVVRLRVMRSASVGATLGPLDVTVQGSRATVKFKAVLTGGAGGLLPERAQGYDITSGWKDVDGDWQVVAADWTEAL